MWKGIVAGGIALAIAGSSLVYAQQRGGSDGPRRGPDQVQRWRPSADDMRAFGEARLAALKAGLALSAEQEKNWPAYEEAAREMGKLRRDRMAARRDAQPSNDPADRLRRRAAAMTDTGAVLKKLADATDPLYKSLDDSQKRRFAMLSRGGGSRMGGPGHHFRGRDGDHDFRGPRHWGPRRTDGGTERFGQKGEQRI